MTLLDKITNKLTTHETVEGAPVVKERVHEHAEHVDKTHVQEAHEKTRVEQVVQPVVDEQREGVKTRTEDHGTEVHEHGRGGLDATTEAELEARRAKVAATGGTTTDRRETERSERPDVDVTDRTHTVEQVIPVVERDIYKPEVVEHHKKQVEIVHDRPELAGTTVNAPIALSDYKGSNREGLTSTSTRRSGDSSSSSSSSSEDESGHRYNAEQRAARKTSRRSKLTKEQRRERQLRRTQKPGYVPHKQHKSLLDKAKNAVGIDTTSKTNDASLQRAPSAGQVRT